MPNCASNRPSSSMFDSMSHIDRAIIAQLEREARLTNTELASRVNLIPRHLVCDGSATWNAPSSSMIDSMDAIDRAIIAQLEREGRLSNTELASRVNLSPT